MCFKLICILSLHVYQVYMYLKCTCILRVEIIPSIDVVKQEISYLVEVSEYGNADWHYSGEETSLWRLSVYWPCQRTDLIGDVGSSVLA